MKVINLQIKQLMRINHNIITISDLYKRNVCAYTLWSVLEINTGFRRHRRSIEDLRRMDLDEETPLSSSLVSSPGFDFLGPSRPDLVMH